MSQREKFVAEIERLKRLRASLDQDWSRTRYLGIFLPLAVPAGYVWGPVAAGLVVGLVVSLVATTLYLIGVRQREYTGEIELYERDLKRLDSGKTVT